MRLLPLAVALAFCASGCKEEPAAPAPSKPAAAPPVKPRAVTGPAEVELSGKVLLPAGATPTGSTVWVVDRACFAPGAKVFGKAIVQPTGQFFVEVLVPQGTQLWLCAGVEEAGKPLTTYGSAKGAPFLGQGGGEVEYTQLEVPVAVGAAVEVPGAAPHPGGADAGS